MSDIWNALLEGLGSILQTFHTITSPIFGEQLAWGWAIILLTFFVRLLLVPLAIKQTRSMRAMQQLAPQIKKIQAKYKVDRSLMRTDPQRYREQRQKSQEETMKLYQEAGANPAAGCLPLLLQMPIFIALFNVLRTPPESVQALSNAPWYGIGALEQAPRAVGELPPAGIGAWILIVLMVVTAFWSQKQMMSRQVVTSDQMAQQQKILLYFMPAMLAFFSFNFPSGVLIYWVATNIWTMGQQWVIFRRVDDTVEPPPNNDPQPVRAPGSSAAKGKRPPAGGGPKGATPGTTGTKRAAPLPEGNGKRARTPNGQADGNGRPARPAGKQGDQRGKGNGAPARPAGKQGGDQRGKGNGAPARESDVKRRAHRGDDVA